MARRSPNSQRTVRPSSTPARRKGVPLSPLAEQMLNDMQLAGLSERTHESYLRSVRKFAQWLGKSPQVASENDLRRYLLFIKNDQQWEANSLKVAYAGLKFFYAHTCPQDWPTLTKLRVARHVKLRAVLTIAEVDQRQIQKYMGHSSLQTTTLYLHLTTVGEEIAVAKIHALMTDRQVSHV